MKQEISRMEKARQVFEKNPKANPVLVAKELKMAVTQAYKARKEVLQTRGFTKSTTPHDRRLALVSDMLNQLALMQRRLIAELEN